MDKGEMHSYRSKNKEEIEDEQGLTPEKWLCF